VVRAVDVAVIVEVEGEVRGVGVEDCCCCEEVVAVDNNKGL
jgi:hypothetical protein